MKFALPHEVYVSRNKKFILNLNNYRNAHYQVLNNAKIEFKNIVASLLIGKKFKTPICLKYELIRGSKRVCDTMNILSIVDKFFCDALVECGCIEDDTYNFISFHTFSYKGYEKGEDRIIVEIIES